MTAAERLHEQPDRPTRIPDLLVRDLFVAVQLTETRPSARSRLAEALGPELADRLIKALVGQSRRAA